MKTNFLLLSLFSCFGLQAIAKTHPGNPFSKTKHQQNQNIGYSKQSTQFLPKLTLRNWWNLDQWSSFADTIHNTYDSQGRIIKEVSPYYQNLNTYDAQGNLTESLSLNWNYTTESWDSIRKSVSTYDIHGTETLYTSYAYANDLWEMEYSYRSINTYNNLNQLSEQITADWVSDTTYQFSSKVLFVYNNLGEVSDAELMEWNDVLQEFTKSFSVTDIQWFKWSGNVEVSLPLTMTMREWHDSVYVLASRQNTTYDSHDNETEYVVEDYDGTTWTHVDGRKSLLTYNSNGAMTERIYQNFDRDSGYYINSTKERFSDFITYTAVQNAVSNNNNISLYPNPASSFITIEVSKDLISETISIYNVTGMNVLQSPLNSNHNQIDISLLPKGLYIYKLQSGATGKLMIN